MAGSWPRDTASVIVTDENVAWSAKGSKRSVRQSLDWPKDTDSKTKSLKEIQD